MKAPQAIAQHYTHDCVGLRSVRGVGAASLRVIPMAIVSFGTYEAVRVWLMGLEDSRRREQALRIAAAEQELLCS